MTSRNPKSDRAPNRAASVAASIARCAGPPSNANPTIGPTVGGTDLPELIRVWTRFEPFAHTVCGTRAHPVSTAPPTINTSAGHTPSPGTSHTTAATGTSAQPSTPTPTSTRASSTDPDPVRPRRLCRPGHQVPVSTASHRGNAVNSCSADTDPTSHSATWSPGANTAAASPIIPPSSAYM